MKYVSHLISMLIYLLVYGNAMSVYRDTFFVTEGDSFFLKCYMGETGEVPEISMHHDDIRYIIVRCDHLNCIFDYNEHRDGLKLYKDGSLTITNTKVTDSGDYHIKINFKDSAYFRSYTVVVRGFFSFDTDGVSVMEGDSVTLHTGEQMKQGEMICVLMKPKEKIGFQMNQLEKIRWYFNQTVIARIIEYHPFFGDLSYICTDVQCDGGEERFRDRLKLDNQTGSLTITDIRTTDSGRYDLLINWDHIFSIRSSTSSNTKIFIVAVHGVSAAERDKMKRKSVKEGESVTLDTHVMKNPHHSITWYFNDIRIAEITGDQSKICSDVQCNERFRDRLHLDHQTGSLTITNTRTTDSGLYKLQIIISRFTIMRTFSVSAASFFSFDTDGVSVMEGDSVTLHTGVQMNEEQYIRWYFNHTEIAGILGDLSYICTDVQCNGGNERFRDRLKLDNQTGSLTITNIRTTDSGLYDLLINWDHHFIRHSSIRSSNTKNFIVAVHGVSAAERDKMKRKSVKEGESVTLDTHVMKNLHHSITWYFNGTLITEITRDQSKICTDERFRDRLKLDHQTGSLTITNITNTDSGEYKLQIGSSRFTIMRTFSVSAASFFHFDTNGVSVMEGDSVTLRTGVKMKQKQKIIVRMKPKEMIRWYFNQMQIARVSYICTDVQCNEDTERFRNGLKLDHQTGSLTITNARTTDSGLYKLLINRVQHRGIWRKKSNTKIFNFVVHGVSAAERDEMKTKSVKEGESVTLHAHHVTKNPNNSITWYFNGTLITEITRDQSEICSDVQCNERFRDRLKLNHQTGSLIITNTRTTDSGLYKLQIRNSRFTIMRTFSVSAASVVSVSKKSGDTLTLQTGVKTNQQEKIRWYFNDILIAEITGNLRKICTYVRCKERFKDRLKLEEFGSLTIMNITTEDAGEYKLKISGRIVEIFCVSVSSKRC